MDEERRRILNLVHAGRISAQEAEALLLELEAAQAVEQAEPRWQEMDAGPCLGGHWWGGCRAVDGEWVSAVVARRIGRAARRAFRAARRRHGWTL